MSKKSNPVTPSLKITNKKILDYYNNNKHINIETVNLLIIDLFESVGSASLDNPSIVKDIVRTLSDQTNLLNNMMITNEKTNNEVTKINENLKNDMENIKMLLNNVSSSLISKIYETKDHYISEIKNNLKINNTESLLNLVGLITDKINLILNDIIPQSQSKCYNDIVGRFSKDMLVTLKSLNDKSSDISLDKIGVVIEGKYNNLVMNINNQLNNMITSTEDRLSTNLNQIKDISLKSSILQENLTNDFVTYTNKYNKSSLKGSMAEKVLLKLLEDNYPSSEVIDTTGKTEMGDILLKRAEKVMILFETKNYTTPVKREEVDKFLRDITKNKCNGVFISQTSGIIGKENYQIDIHDNNILIYIHNCDNDISKINIAVNMIDIISSKLVNINNTISLSKETLCKISQEYNRFMNNREMMVVNLKDYYKKTLDQFNDLKLPELQLYLSEHFADNKQNLFICNICNNYQTDNLKSISKHKDHCKIKNSESKQKVKKSPKKKLGKEIDSPTENILEI